jgi:hypothetical protein
MSDKHDNQNVTCECNCHKPNEYGIMLGWMWCPNCEENHGVNFVMKRSIE